MKRKINVIPILLLSVLLFGTVIGTAFSVGSTSIKSVNQFQEYAYEYPSVYISPDHVTDVNVGDVFTVTVAVSGLSDENLYGFDIELKWDTDVLEYVAHEVKVPVETYPEGVLHQPVIEIMDEVDTSAGTYWLAYASLLPAEPFNGDGVFFTISFVLLKTSDTPFALEHVVLASKDGDIIPIDEGSNFEIPILPSSLGGLTEYQVLRNIRWLEWWITVTVGASKRRS